MHVTYIIDFQYWHFVLVQQLNFVVVTNLTLTKPMNIANLL